MTTDTQKSILTAIYNLLTSDVTLKAAMGGTCRLFLTWATPDAEFPYLVNRIDLSGWSVEYSPLRKGTYIIDIWSNSTNANEILAIRNEVKRLLNGLQFVTAEVDMAMLWLQTDGFIPEATQNIWHYTMQFNIRMLEENGQPRLN